MTATTHQNTPPSGATPGVDPKTFTRFADFYPFYLKEHSNRTCRRLHFLGSSLALVCLALAVFNANPAWVLAGLLCGYGCAWIGHFGFEHNRPASFKRPLYSFLGDWAMYRDIWMGRIPF
ncbi:MAG: Mpo1-like protein [Hydrogenophaga sp.]